MTMKLKYICIGLLLVLFSLPAAAQQNQGDFEAVRIAFLTRKLALTPEEAKVFWPVYDAYQAELKSVKRELKQAGFAARNDFTGMSDAEVEKVVESYLVAKRQEVEVIEKYHGQFKEVLPIRKVVQLYKAEQEFTKLLLKRLQERRQGNGGGPAGRRRRF